MIAGGTAVRAATPADAAAVAHTHRQCWQETYRGHLPDAVVDGRAAPEFEALWAERLGSGGTEPVFVAEGPGGEVAGFASGGPLRVELPGHDGEIVTLYVLARHHRTGLGATLFARVAEAMAGLGYRSLVAQVLSTIPALGFYGRLGGREVERRPFVYRGAPVTTVYVAWRLPWARP